MRAKRIAKTEEDKWFDKCDALYPKLSYGRCCRVCESLWRQVPAECIHHYIRRGTLITRFYLPNLIPLCTKHHQMIHEGKLSEPLSEELKDHLTKMGNKNLKGYCIAKGITKAEYFEQCYKIMKENLL